MLLIEKVLLLRNSSIFQNCKETDLVELASICLEETVEAGTVLFRKGDAGNCVYFINKGRVSIHDGEHQLAELSDNELFGELSMLDAETRSASATAITESWLLKIEQEDFYDVVATNIDILKGIMKTLCRRLREQDHINIELRRLQVSAP